VLYETFARPLLFKLDPETAHRIALSSLDRLYAAGLLRTAGGLSLPAADPVQAMGLTFPNPVGLAAGLDKNARHVDALGALGFGFVEVGTVTPRAQPGNPRPRMFRLPAAQALINRLGFNNGGLAGFLDNLQRSSRFCAGGGIVGLNIGKNADTPIERALDDYLLGLRGVYPLLTRRAGYIAVNISSPNTQNLRSLQGADELSRLLDGLMQERRRLADAHGRQVPMAVKIAPDLPDEALPRLAETLTSHGIDAVIATNTTISREAVHGLPHAQETGGLSGAPLRERSNAVVRLLRQHLGPAFPIIGVGGITCGADAAEKIRAGATLVQLYSGLIYRGPALIGEARRAILSARATAGAAASAGTAARAV
jgi:dihydroorotate dehydrogenase